MNLSVRLTYYWDSFFLSVFNENSSTCLSILLFAFPCVTTTKSRRRRWKSDGSTTLSWNPLHGELCSCYTDTILEQIEFVSPFDIKFPFSNQNYTFSKAYTWEYRSLVSYDSRRPFRKRYMAALLSVRMTILTDDKAAMYLFSKRSPPTLSSFDQAEIGLLKGTHKSSHFHTKFSSVLKVLLSHFIEEFFCDMIPIPLEPTLSVSRIQ